MNIFCWRHALLSDLEKTDYVYDNLRAKIRLYLLLKNISTITEFIQAEDHEEFVGEMKCKEDSIKNAVIS